MIRNRFLIQKYSEDSIEKIEEIKWLITKKSGELVYPSNGNYLIDSNEKNSSVKYDVNIEQLKKYREFIIQLENEKNISDVHIYNAKESHENIKVKTLENGQIEYRPNDL